jgi:uncharacterized protein YdaU (DUF1376 family)
MNKTSLSYMPIFVGDYIRDTRHLTLEEHGAYLLLLMSYWVGGGLPDDDAQLARIVGMKPARWRKIKPTIKAFFSDDGWHHEVLDEQFAKSWARSERGKKGAAATWGKNVIKFPVKVDA